MNQDEVKILAEEFRKQIAEGKEPDVEDVQVPFRSRITSEMIVEAIKLAKENHGA